MAEDYYKRTGTPQPSNGVITRLDGSRHFHTPEDEEAQNEVAKLAAAAFGCEFHQFGALTPIDWYAIRDGRMVGLAEFKKRHHEIAKYPDVWLNVRKWLALTMGAVGLGVPAIYVVQFTDATVWVPLASVDGTRHRMAGLTHIMKSRSDIEPIIHVPMALFKPLPARD